MLNFKWLPERFRRFIGKRALKKYYARYLHEELGLSKEEAREKAYAYVHEGSARPVKRSRPGIFQWITSDEGRKVSDLEFILTLAETLLEKVVSGELTREELQKLVISDNPFRALRLKGMADAQLDAMINARELQEQHELDRLQDAVKAGRNAPLSSQDLFKRAMVFVQGVFEKPEGPDPEAVRLQQQKRKQYVLEMERMEKMKMAALANSPEFLESLGAPDHFDSAGQQSRREERIIAKEQKKLRPRLTKEDIAPVRPREKSPKELAEEKLRMVRKLKQGGGFGSSV